MSRSDRLLLPPALVLGVLVFLAGLALARAWLPEWQDRLPGEKLIRERYKELALRGGARLVRGEPRVALHKRDQNLQQSEEALDRLGPEEAAALGAGVFVRVSQEATLAGSGDQRGLRIDFDTAGEPRLVGWGMRESEIFQATLRGRSVLPAERQARLARLLLRPGETLGRVRFDDAAGGVGQSSVPIPGSDPPQRIRTLSVPGESFSAFRELEEREQRPEIDMPVANLLLEVLPAALGVLTILGLFPILIGKRRIDLRTGALLAVASFTASALPVLFDDPTWKSSFELLSIAFVALWVLVLWSTGESYLRSVHPGLTTTGLDALRSRRLGPRGGRALLAGVAGGATLAGLHLAAYAAASRLPRAWPDEYSLRLPLFGIVNPLSDGALLAAAVALALALALRFLPRRWAPAAAVVAAGLAVSPVELEPLPLMLGVNLVLAGLLVALCLRAGLAALLVAAATSFLLPAAAFAALHLDWLPVSFAVAAALPLGLVVLGGIGLRRPADREVERLKPPAFMQRLEDERRVRYEMDLLATMQRDLLPASVPELPGWEIAAQSTIATEAGGDLYDFLRDDEGGLWIAAGDVAGHGYSCSIVQSMTTAALTSLIVPGLSPSQVLRQIDRVIRRGGSQRNFITLALLRLDPDSGAAVFANAGHPFPLLVAGGGAEEIPAAGLPLGKGPDRRYADVAFHIPAGGVLVLCSDGLFEAADLKLRQYGFDRPRDLLRGLADRPAREILEALLADWRRHLDGEAPQDDTTIVVVKRTVAAISGGGDLLPASTGP